MISKRFTLFVSAAAMVVMLWPTDAAAQRGHGHGGGHPGGTHVSVGVGFGHGYYPRYYSPFYNPFYFGIGFGWYSGGWYPWYPYGYGYGYPPYAYAGYPYGYYGWSSVRIEMQPREAQVYVDGYYAGVVDNFDGVFQRLDVPPGAHELAVYLPGYHTYREQMMFRPGSGYHIKAILQPLPAGAAPEPQPQPVPGAHGRDPYARQNPNGYGPPQGRDPYGAPDRYAAPAPDPYGPPPAGEGRTVPLPERRAPQRPPQGQYSASDFGTLTLRVQPGDAVVTIDGERWDSADAGSRLIVQLSGGQHRVEVHKDGFRPYTTTIEVRPGETQSLNISLPPGL